MRKNFGAKPNVYPMPVFILATYDTAGVPDAMNAAWGGICGDSQIMFCLASDHKTTENILANGCFTVSMADADHIAACDYVGIVSGNSVPDKLARAGFHTTRAEFVDAPLIDELPMALECKLIHFDEETGILTADIVNVSADECVLGANGKVDPAKLRPITFDAMNNAYLVLGERVGTAFKDGLSLK